ncbi:hypothetical protein P8452_16744 [Trifolium repens]|nr:hypothetical protein P8452_16744 [Trifolium repens]
MRDYIMGNQERTAPKRKTLGEYFIESKLDAIIRQLEALASAFCDHCYLDSHESEECPTRNLWDDCEIVHSDEQHNPHPPNWDINYIPPCLRRQSPKRMEEQNVNDTLTTLSQNTINELSQKPQESISVCVDPNFEAEDEVNLLTSGVDLNEKLRHEGQVLIESEEALTEESTCEEQHKQDLVVVDMEKSKESPFILGQTILTIGDVIVEVQKGKDSLEKISILQDPSIMVATNFSAKIAAQMKAVEQRATDAEQRANAAEQRANVAQEESQRANKCTKNLERQVKKLAENISCIKGDQHRRHRDYEEDDSDSMDDSVDSLDD